MLLSDSFTQFCSLPEESLFYSITVSAQRWEINSRAFTSYKILNVKKGLNFTHILRHRHTQTKRHWSEIVLKRCDSFLQFTMTLHLSLGFLLKWQTRWIISEGVVSCIFNKRVVRESFRFSRENRDFRLLFDLIRADQWLGLHCYYGTLRGKEVFN